MTDKRDDFSWFVYIVRTDCGCLYTGITRDIERRFSEHLAMFDRKAGKGAKYFLGRKPKEIVYKESLSSRSLASKRESQIKKMTKSQKNSLIVSKPFVQS